MTGHVFNPIVCMTQILQILLDLILVLMTIVVKSCTCTQIKILTHVHKEMNQQSHSNDYTRNSKNVE